MTLKLGLRKARLRSELRLSLKALNPAERMSRSRKIVRKLLRSSDYKRSGRLCCYVSKPGEVETRALLQRALRSGKLVFVPRVDRRNRSIKIYEIRNLKRDLKKGVYGILEPSSNRSRLGKASELDLVVVPGLGFDRSGRRLGRGGGYFDRFLKSLKRPRKIGLAFREQIVKKIPTDRQDVCVDRMMIG